MKLLFPPGASLEVGGGEGVFGESTRDTETSDQRRGEGEGGADGIREEGTSSGQPLVSDCLRTWMTESML